jgi:hypothetical protein
MRTSNELQKISKKYPIFAPRQIYEIPKGTTYLAVGMSDKNSKKCDESWKNALKFQQFNDSFFLTLFVYFFGTQNHQKVSSKMISKNAP